MTDSSYNDRLFKKGIRSRLHLSRFYWLNRTLTQMDIHSQSVIELGCYDGKTLNFFPEAPEYYLGLDANWEGGLDLAKEIWKEHPTYEFSACSDPSDIQTIHLFDIAVCMETLEHIPANTVDDYLSILSQKTRNIAFFTFPNEKGLIFAAKYLTKKVLRLSPEPYTTSEFFNTLFGKLHRIERNEHKGFDYDQMIQQISCHFEIIQIVPLPIEWLPVSLGFNVGVIARPRRKPEAV